MIHDPKQFSQETLNDITAKVAKQFRCFGGGKAVVGNPISFALANEPPSFAAGVIVEEVVTFVSNEVLIAVSKLLDRRLAEIQKQNDVITHVH